MGNNDIYVPFRCKLQPVLYDSFDCEKCGCQNIVGERKRYTSAEGLKFIEVEGKVADEEEPQNEVIKGPEDYDREDILKKIEEAGE